MSIKERELYQRLSDHKKKEFQFSRGCARHALSSLLSIDPLKVPLFAKPGSPPVLGDGLGNISFSHCKGAFVIAWSSEKIGVDIEKKIEN